MSGCGGLLLARSFTCPVADTDPHMVTDTLPRAKLTRAVEVIRALRAVAAVLEAGLVAAAQPAAVAVAAAASASAAAFRRVPGLHQPLQAPEPRQEHQPAAAPR